MPAYSDESTTAAALKAYEEKIAGTIHAANVKIDEFETKAKAARAQAEIAAVNALKSGRQKLEQMLHDLDDTQAAQVARAKVDIDAAVVALERSLEDFRRKFTRKEQ